MKIPEIPENTFWMGVALGVFIYQMAKLFITKGRKS